MGFTYSCLHLLQLVLYFIHYTSMLNVVYSFQLFHSPLPAKSTYAVVTVFFVSDTSRILYREKKYDEYFYILLPNSMININIRSCSRFRLLDFASTKRSEKQNETQMQSLILARKIRFTKYAEDSKSDAYEAYEI